MASALSPCEFDDNGSSLPSAAFSGMDKPNVARTLRAAKKTVRHAQDAS
jgi:hypothetical protein